MFAQLCYELVPLDAPSHFTDHTPRATRVCQILGVDHEFDKAQVVSKEKIASTRKRRDTSKDFRIVI